MKISLSPSGADTWLRCRAQPRLVAENAHRIVRVDKQYNIDGNIAHEYAAKHLINGGVHFDKEHRFMKEAVQHYADFINARKLPDDEHFVEQKFPLWYMPGRNGYIDSILINPKRIRVTDFKFGEGVAVFAQDNPQLAIYGRTAIELLRSFGLMDIPPDLPVFIDIIQPRCRHGQAESTWELTVAELDAWTGERIEPVAKSIIAGEPQEFYPYDDDVCRWCDAALFCEARSGYLMKTEALDVFDVILETEVGEAPALPAYSTLPPEFLSKALHFKDAMTGWFSKLEEYAKEALHAGKPDLIPDWKLVDGKNGARRWKDETEVLEALSTLLDEDDLWSERKLLSPAQAEKLLKGKTGKAIVAEYSAKGKPAKVLAPASDEREAVHVTISDEFENLEATDECGDLL